MHFEDVSAGNEIPALQKVPDTRQLVQWAGASGDFYPIHYDQEFARQQGLPGVIVHGLLKYQFLVQMLSDWVGLNGGIRKVAVRYRSMDVPGDVLTCRGKVIDKRVEDGLCLVECDIWLESQRGERTTTGTAVVWLRSRHREDRES